MKSKKEIYNNREVRIKSSIKNVGSGSEFGLSLMQIFEDTVRKAKELGLLAGQAVSLYQVINQDK